MMRKIYGHKRFVVAFAAALLLFAFASFGVTAQEATQSDDYSVAVKTQDGSIYRFDVELALRPRDHERGLMGRESMPQTHGMMFIFNSNEPRKFWMKNTLIPLDIIFIKQNGTIDHIHSNARPLSRTLVTSGRDAYAVLEINGGVSDSLGISPGDVIYHPAFRNMNLLGK